MRRVVPSGLLLGALFLPGPALAMEEVGLVEAPGDLPEASLLDIGVVVFDPGISEEPDALRKLKAAGVFPEVRKAEARYVPVLLSRTLQETGLWGAVRVVPAGSIHDLIVTGVIRSSTGAELELEIRVVDSRGEVWLDKRYKTRPDANAYRLREPGEPFEELYMRVANDMVSRRMKVDDKNVARIRDVTLLKFAADLAPSVFADYLSTSKNRYSVVRLPSRDDPMMARIERLRGADRMLIDTLDAYYRDFHDRMRVAYNGWRSQDYWRREAMKRSGRRTPPFARGAGAVSPGPYATEVDVPSVGVGSECGTLQLIRGMQGSNDRTASTESTGVDHAEVLRELGASLASDVAPLLIEVEGNVLKLTGSTETQYVLWRQLLREIFLTETGVPALQGSTGSTTS